MVSRDREALVLGTLEKLRRAEESDASSLGGGSPYDLEVRRAQLLRNALTEAWEAGWSAGYAACGLDHTAGREAQQRAEKAEQAAQTEEEPL